MPSPFQLLRVFVSSPDDVKEEREIAESVIDDINKKTSEVLGVRLDCIKWEHIPPITPPPREGKIQDQINDLIKTCDIFVLILYKRYGSSEPGKKSNTEREVELASKRLKKHQRPDFLSYFREIPDNPDRGKQEKDVIELRDRLAREGIHYQKYKGPIDFKNYFIHDLYNIILKYRLSTAKQKALRAFWRLGITEGQAVPKLTIVYPALDSVFMTCPKPDEIWLERLVPNIVFEDFKAIQKIDRTLSLIGFDDIDTYSTISCPADIQDSNRLWICLPRNLRGLKHVQLYRNISKFRFIPRQGDQEACLYWHPKPSAAEIEVKSPLSQYLKIQRASHLGREWRSEHGKIVARDYAILARFPVRKARKPMTSGVLQDYFLAGIRGLGTWGAAWFLDRMYDAFLPYDDEDKPIQFLLEVTYVDEVIREVRDISNEPQSYFDEQNQTSKIQQVIDDNHLG